MTLATYTDLQAAIANYLARPGDSNVTTPAPDFVTLAESRIAYGMASGQFICRPLRIRAMETVATLITGGAQAATGVSGGSVNAQTVALAAALAHTPGTAIDFTAGLSNTGAMTVDAGAGPVAVKKGVPQADLGAGDIVAGGAYELYDDGTCYNLVPVGGVPLPAGYLEMRAIALQTTPSVKLHPVTPETIDDTYLGLGPDKPQAYALDGDCIRFAPRADAAYAVRMSFYRKFPALSASCPANWLLTNKPDIYLWGSLLEAAIYLGDDEGMQRYYALYCGALEGLQNANQRDRYSGGALQMNSGIMGA